MTTTDKSELIDSLNQQITNAIQAEDDNLEYEALLAVNSALLDRTLAHGDVREMSKAFDHGVSGSLEEIADAYSPLDEDEGIDYTMLIDHLQTPYAHELYGVVGVGESNPEAFERIAGLLIEAGVANSIRKEHEAFLALDAALTQDHVTRADAYAIINRVHGYAVISGIQIVIFGHETGMNTKVDDFVDSIITRRAIEDMYGGHGSDFDDYVDSSYIGNFIEGWNEDGDE